MTFTYTVFETDLKNHYLYDSVSGHILPIPKHLYCRHKTAFTAIEAEKNGSKQIVRSNSDVRDAILHLRSFIEHGLLKANRLECVDLPYDTAELLERLGDSIGMLTLQLTDRCNLKCGYCIYHGYDVSGDQSVISSMSFDIGTRAIDFYHSHSKRSSSNPCIQFYGGEPLLEFETLREMVFYARKKFSDRQPPQFSISTNGTLLKGKVLEFFLSSPDVRLCITLNGPKKIHDAQRTYAGGQGSHAEIVRNIAKIWEASPDAYTKRVAFLANYRGSMDIRRIALFYGNDSLLRGPPPSLSPIIRKPHDVPKRGLTASTPPFSYLRTKYMRLIKSREFIDPTLAKMVGDVFAKFRDGLTHTSGDQAQFTGACLPFVKKTYVRTDGSITICEKVPGPRSFGNVLTGFDIDAILRILNEFRSIYGMRCRYCYALRFCDVCFDQLLSCSRKDSYDQNSFCKAERIKAREGLRFFVEQYE